MATMTDIARLAGVSRGTVDRVINKRGGVGPETTDRILRAVEQLSYSPNRAARSLSTGKNAYLLTLILFNPEKARFYRDVLDGAEQEAENLKENGVTVRYRFLESWEETEILGQLNGAVVDGSSGIAIFGTGDHAVVERIREITASGIPVITVGSELPDCGQLGYVGSDAFRAGQTAADLIRLICRGEIRVGAILGRRSRFFHDSRMAGLTAGLAGGSRPWRVEFTEYNDGDDFDCFMLVQELMQQHPEINVLFLSTGNVYGACRALEQMSIPKLPKVVCYDNTPAIRDMMQRGLISASIGQEPFRQGSEPLKLLLDHLAFGTELKGRKLYTKDEIFIAENL